MEEAPHLPMRVVACAVLVSCVARAACSCVRMCACARVFVPRYHSMGMHGGIPNATAARVLAKIQKWLHSACPVLPASQQFLSTPATSCPSPFETVQEFFKQRLDSPSPRERQRSLVLVQVATHCARLLQRPAHLCAFVACFVLLPNAP
uniref:Secreted protein n=1 Tax=Eutreptiella gymnastica TaxID=73025 RepID=A0A7S4D0V0_9EUGL